MPRKQFSRTARKFLSHAAVSLVLASCAAASSYTVLHVFQWASEPQGGMTFDAAGNLYGAAAAGAGHNLGAIFKLTPHADGNWTSTIIHGFSGPDGQIPNGELVFDSAGNLYGTTLAGGTHSSGVVFKLTPHKNGTWTETVLYNFKGAADGGFPTAGLIFDAAGNLYGTTSGNAFDGPICSTFCDVVFKLAPHTDGTWTESVLHTFTGLDGGNPYARLVFDRAGNLYSTTANGGPAGSGDVFELTPNGDSTWKFSIIFAFDGGSDGGGPSSELIIDGSGNLYGLASYGGSSIVTEDCNDIGCGLVFQLTPSASGTWTENVLYTFLGQEDGGPPNIGDALIFDAAGNLYGTTTFGGLAPKACTSFGQVGCGVVFELTPGMGGWNESVVHSFDGFGKWTYSRLVLGASGDLYGTTFSGCTGHGLAFKITP